MSSLDAQFAALETKLNDCVKAVALKTADLAHEMVSAPIGTPGTFDSGRTCNSFVYQGRTRYSNCIVGIWKYERFAYLLTFCRRESFFTQ